MGIIQQQAIKGGVITIAGAVLGFVSVSLLQPLILSAEEIGVVRLMHAYASLFAVFFCFGLPAITIRMFPHFRSDDNSHNGFLFLAVVIFVAGFVLAMLFLFPLAHQLINPNGEGTGIPERYFLLLIPVIFFYLLYDAMDAYLRSIFYSVVGAFYRELVQRAIVIAALLLVWCQFLTAHQFIWVYSLALCFPGLALVLFALYLRQFNLIPQKKFYTKALLKEMASVGIFGLMISSGGIFIMQVDTVMVTRYLGTEATGIYATCFFYGSVVAMASRALKRIATSVIADAWKNNDLQTISHVYNQSCINQFIIGLFVYLGVVTNLDSIFQIIPAEYAQGRYVIVFIGMAFLVDMLTGVNAEIIGTSKHYRYNLYLVLILIMVAISSNYLLIKVLGMGINGAAISSLITLAIFNLLRYLVLYWKYSFQPMNGKFVGIAGLGVLSWGVCKILPDTGSIFLDIPINGMLVVLLFLVPVYLLGYSAEINRWTSSSLARLGLRNNR